jgi:hypothetical protein
MEKVQYDATNTSGYLDAVDKMSEFVAAAPDVISAQFET